METRNQITYISRIIFTFLRYGYLRYASFDFRDGHLQNRLVAIQLWIDAFMIWTILFQIVIIEFCHSYTSITGQPAGRLVKSRLDI